MRNCLAGLLARFLTLRAACRGEAEVVEIVMAPVRPGKGRTHP